MTMNADQWFEEYRALPGLFVTADEVAAAIAAAPDDIDQRTPPDDAAFQTSLASGAAAARWQRWLAGEDVPPAPAADSEISGPDELYAYLWGYEHAARAPA